MKRLVLGAYKPPSANDATFLDQIKLTLNNYSKSYENFSFIGDFNMTVENSDLNDLIINNFYFENQIKEFACYKLVQI